MCLSLSGTPNIDYLQAEIIWSGLVILYAATLTASASQPCNLQIMIYNIEMVTFLIFYLASFEMSNMYG